MATLVALKTLRYPRGPSGREYGPGDSFDVASERDAKALKLVRAAKDAPVVAPVKAPPMAQAAKAPPPAADPVPEKAHPAKARRAEAPKTPDGPVAPVSTESGEALVPGNSGRYRRSDMRAEE